MSGFDADTFLNTQMEGTLETKVVPVPEGEYSAVISKVDAREPKDGVRVLEVFWTLTDPAVAQGLGLEEATVRQSMFLDFNDDGSLAFGTNKNVRLGRVREAVGQNDGSPWAPSRLNGAGPALIRVGHRVDPDDPEIKYAEVKRVTKLA